MNCPYCGYEASPGENFCRSCGAQLATAVPTQEGAVPAQQVYAVPAAELPKTLKEFITSPYCTPDVNKNFKASWITMFICAGLSIVVAVAQGSFPIDGIIMAAIAVWLLLSKSFAAGLTACIVGVLELVLTSIYMGQLAGWLPAMAGVYALLAALKAKKQFKAFLDSQQTGV